MTDRRGGILLSLVLSSDVVKNLGILLFPQGEELDFVGPWEMATMWQAVAKPSEAVLGRCLLVSQGPGPITCAKGMQVVPHTTFTDCPDLDVLLVPGGQGTRQEVNNPVLIDFVARQAAHAKVLISVCTGAFVLHAAGCLAGKRATTHWGSLEWLRALGDVAVVEERWVRDGAVWTSAGVSAGMDVMLAVIAELAGEEVAGRVQFASEYYPAPRRYGDFTGHPGMPAYAGSGSVSSS